MSFFFGIHRKPKQVDPEILNTLHAAIESYERAIGHYVTANQKNDEIIAKLNELVSNQRRVITELEIMIRTLTEDRDKLVLEVQSLEREFGGVSATQTRDP